MKVLLTGAAGGLGSATLRHFHGAGLDVRATDVRASFKAPVRIQVANLLQPESCYTLLEDVQVLVHLANHPNPDHGTAQQIFGENVTMNMNILQAAKEMGVKKIVFASSVQAFMGDRRARNADAPTAVRYLPVDGLHPVTPANPYALSKSTTENMLEYFVRFHGIQSAVAVRFPLLMRSEWMPGRAKMMTTPPTVAPGTMLDELFTWLSVEDAARLLLAIVKAELPGYRCYMPAAPTPRINMSIREIIEKYFKNVPLRRPIEQIDALWDISGITAETAWKPIDNFWEMK
jgi:nucleoside-diphosphate-sugar epimerase